MMENGGMKALKALNLIMPKSANESKTKRFKLKELRDLLGDYTNERMKHKVGQKFYVKPSKQFTFGPEIWPSQFVSRFIKKRKSFRHHLGTFLELFSETIYKALKTSISRLISHAKQFSLINMIFYLNT